MLKAGEKAPGGNSLTHFKSEFPDFRTRPRPYSKFTNIFHALKISGHYLDLINKTRAHISAATRDFNIRPVLTVNAEIEDFAASLLAKYVGRICVCCPHRYVAAFSDPASATAAAKAWGTEAYVGSDDDYWPSYMVDLPEDLCFVAWCGDGMDWPQFEYEEALDDFRRSKVYASVVLCLVNHKFLRVHELARLLEKQTTGNSCIPETYEYNHASLVVSVGRRLGQLEREALYLHTGVTESSLSELAAEAHAATSEARRELYGGDDYY